MIAPKTSRRQLAWELTLYCLTRSKRLHQESKADSTSLSRVMAAVANQVHSTAQQIGARIGWNPIDAATQPPTGTRERVLNLSDPRTNHRNLGFEDSCLSGAPPSFSRRFGQVVDDGGNRFRSRHACRWMAHSQVRQSEHRDWVDIGVWPRTALDCRIQYGPNTVGRSSFLWGGEVRIRNCLLRIAFFHVRKIILGHCERLMPDCYVSELISVGALRVRMLALRQRLLAEPAHEVDDVLLDHILHVALGAIFNEWVDGTAIRADALRICTTCFKVREIPLACRS